MENYTKSENETLETDGEKQNSMPPAEIRKLRNTATAMIQFWRDSENTVHFRGPNFHGTLG